MKRIKGYLLCILLITCFFIFTATINNTFASSKSIDLKPKIDTAIGKYGYVDNKGKWVIKAQFEEAKDFSDGLALVTYYNDSDDFYKARTGYINSNGKAAFTSRFYRANDFKNGYAAVTDKDEKLSIIDKKGKVVLNTDYYFKLMDCEVKGIHTIISDSAPSKSAQNSKLGYITDKLKLVKPSFEMAPYYYIDNESNESFPNISYSENDANGRLIKLHRYILNKKMEPVELPSDFILGVNEGMILMQCGNNYAYSNMDGKIFDKIYDSKEKKYCKLNKAFNFSEGRAVVAVEDYLKGPYIGGRRFYGYGYLNKDGTTFKNPEYLYANSFKEGLAAVQPYPSWSYKMAILKADGEYLKKPEIRATIKYDKSDEQFMNIDHYSQGEYDYVKSEVKRIVNEIINSKMSDLEKITVINKYVCDHTKYPIGKVFLPWEVGHPLCIDYQQEAIGILKEGFGVCDAFTKLTGLLLKEVGIENIYVIGNANMKDDIHAWNLVKLNGKYYHLDTTWNDVGTTNRYFLVSDKYMKDAGREWNTSKCPAAPEGYFNDKIQPK